MERTADHAVHEFLKAPESDSIVLHDGVDGSKEVAHALDIAQVAVVFVVGQQHILHLLEVDVRADFGKGGIGIGMRYVLALEERDVAIGAVDILFYMLDPKKWVESAVVCLSQGR